MKMQGQVDNAISTLETGKVSMQEISKQSKDTLNS